MVKTRYELIRDAGEDREAMINALEKHDKVMRKSWTLSFIGLGLFLLGLFIVKYFESPLGVIPMFIAPFLIIQAAINPLKAGGLV